MTNIFSAQGTLCAEKYGSDLYYGKASSDYINRWSFQSLCNHVFDTRNGKFDQATTRRSGGISFDPSHVKAGDIIFVRKIELFMKTMHKKIAAPYIMVTHGDFLDTTSNENLRYLDDEKIIAWFSIHPPSQWHPKYFPIPLGVVQKKGLLSKKKRILKHFELLRSKPKTRLLTRIFSVKENPERQKVAQILNGKSFYTVINEGLSFSRYLDELASSVFTLSPRGWGPDCYRTWEALLVGTIPIVKRGQYGVMPIAKRYLRNALYLLPVETQTQLERLYQDLPILVIDDWNEITEEFLRKKYSEITSKKYDIGPLYMEYWRNIIFSVQSEFLKNHRV